MGFYYAMLCRLSAEFFEMADRIFRLTSGLAEFTRKVENAANLWPIFKITAKV